MVRTERIKIIEELESWFGFPIMSIIYNPEGEGIKLGDEQFIYIAMDFLKKEKCILLLSGSGGEFTTSVLMAHLLRKRLNYFKTFVPSIAGSVLCYIILYSDKLVLGQNSLLTQFDPVFDLDGREYRALKEIDNGKEEIRNRARAYFHFVYDQFGHIINDKKNVLKTKNIQLVDSNKIIYKCMGKDCHESEIRPDELEKINFNLEYVQDDIINLGKRLIKLARSELVDNNKRLMIEFKEGYSTL